MKFANIKMVFELPNDEVNVTIKNSKLLNTDYHMLSVFDINQ